jgi:hypothetical protein
MGFGFFWELKFYRIMGLGLYWENGSIGIMGLGLFCVFKNIILV